MKLNYALAMFLFLVGCVSSQQDRLASPVPSVASDRAISDQNMFLTPNLKGHQTIIDEIKNAKQSIKMWIFSISDPDVVNALIDAKNRNIQVQLVIDKGMFLKSVGEANVDIEKTLGRDGANKQIDALISAGISVLKASPEFSISHAKTMIIDDQYAWITTMNLTMHFTAQRDVGVKITDQLIVQDLINLFNVDIENSQNSQGATPIIQSASLIVSPLDSRGKIISELDKAKKSVSLTVENLLDQDVIKELIALSNRGVDVKIIAPLCGILGGPSLNITSLTQLNQGGVNAKAMPGPATIDQPYMHQKMFIVDQSSAFIGSENFSINSLDRAREIGVIVKDPLQITILQQSFDSDFSKSILPDPNLAHKCKEF